MADSLANAPASSRAAAFLAAFDAGRVCLHPTDTLPGLTFDPRSVDAQAALARAKGRDETKPCLGLVADLARAKRFFAPLPNGWDAALARLWPGPLSVVWTASEAAPRTLVAADGSIGLRVPQLPEGQEWFADVLANAAVPVPTTSVNTSGEAPLRAFAGAQAWLQEHAADAFDPFAPLTLTRADGLEPSPGAPSTIVRLHADATFTVIREGALPIAAVRAALGALA